MKIGFYCVFFLALSSCTDVPVEMNLMTFNSVSKLQILNSSTISQNQSVTFSLDTAYQDAQVSRIAIYNVSACDSESAKVSEIANQVGATATSSVLVEGKHTFFYKPVYTNAEANLAALCLPAGLTYTVDRTAPTALVISRTTASPTNDPIVGLSISVCENSDTGASNFLFTESATLIPNAFGPGWESCLTNKTFTVSAAPATKNVYAFAKDLAGNVSTISNPVSVVLAAAPIILAPSLSHTLYVTAPIAPITFSNSGGAITSCTVSPALPSGLLMSLVMTNPNACQITGTPSGTPAVPVVTSHQVVANGYGSSSIVSVSIEVRPRPIALVSFNPQSAGPGIGTAGSSGGQTYQTLLNAAVGGIDVVAYKFALNTPGATTCGAYSTPESQLGVPMVADLAGLDEAKTLCVLGKNIAGVWQQNPTVISWAQGPQLQNLSTDFPGPKNITADNQAAFANVITRGFIVGNAGTDITCTNCLVSKNDGTFLSMQNGLVSTDRVQFKVATSGGSVTSSANFLFATATYFINVKATPASCNVTTNRSQIFLSRNMIGGNMGGISGADNFCNQEAVADAAISPDTGWKAMLSGGGFSGLSVLLAANRYCDATTSHPVISAFPHVFENPFFRFRDGTLVNGGDFSEWKHIVNAPRHITSTQFWFGKENECNCGNWTTDSTTSACIDTAKAGSANVGRLTFDSRAPQPMTSLPDSGIVMGCSQKQHVICVQP